MIFLDLDDALVDHSGAEYLAARYFRCEYATAIPDNDAESFHSIWREAAARHYALFTAGAIDFREQRRRRIREIFQRHDMPGEEADSLFAVYLRYNEDSWRLFEDVIPFLNQYRHVGIGVLSNGSQGQQQLKLRNLGIEGYFSYVITAETAGISKPNPRIFHLACETAGVIPSNVCYVGDNLVHDVLGANSAGLRGVWLNRGREAVPDGVEAKAALTDFML